MMFHFLPLLLNKTLYNTIYIIESRHCVIVYVSHFLPPNLRLVSFRSLLYMMNYLIFMPALPLNLPPYRKTMWVGLRILSLVRGQGDYSCNERTRGGGG